MSEKNLLIISHDVVGQEMAGPGIRYYHLARVLSRTIDTVLAIPQESQPNFQHPDFDIIYYKRDDWSSIADHYKTAQICLLPSDIANDFFEISQDDTVLVIDGYNPLMAEWLSQDHSFTPDEADIAWQNRRQQLSRQYQIGDFFICASERQRDWWLGLLEANGRLNPRNFQHDSSLRTLIDVVPYGLPEASPIHRKKVIRGVWPSITEADYLLLWGGGLWPWLDALTAIRAMAKVWKTRQDVKLVFPGTRHPNPNVAQMSTQNQAAIELADQLGLLDLAIFFGDWVPYEDWPNVLLECDVALTLHNDTLETRLAFRSRVLEYIWAGLPTIATKGDATSDLITHYGIGTVVDYADSDAVAKSIEHWIEAVPKPMQKIQFERACQDLTWLHGASPLIAFCEDPCMAPDRQHQKQMKETNAHKMDILEQDEICQRDLQAQIQTLQAENQHWQKLVQGYESGRFIRFMKRLREIY